MNEGTAHPASYRNAVKRVRKLAAHNGLVLNSDEERVRSVVGRMTENYVAAGRYYCPCKQSDPLDPDADVICPCPEWKEEIARDGHCFCRLFYKE